MARIPGDADKAEPTPTGVPAEIGLAVLVGGALVVLTALRLGFRGVNVQIGS